MEEDDDVEDNDAEEEEMIFVLFVFGEGTVGVLKGLGISRIGILQAYSEKRINIYIYTDTGVICLAKKKEDSM